MAHFPRCIFSGEGIFLIFCLSFCAFVGAEITPAHAGLLSEVSAEQRDEIEKGQTVVLQIPVADAPWPEFRLFRIVKAPPSVVIDLFTDYEAAPSYLPGVDAAKIVENNPDGSVDVEYTVRVPILSVIDYTVQDTVTHKGGETIISWKLIKSSLAKSSDGSLRVESYGKSESILCYTNLCIPRLDFILDLQNEALNEAKATVAAIAAESERRAKGGPVVKPSASPSK